ncbi:MAG TPA: hypothetical protein VKI64_07570, partial [Acidimicrobiales bacterium]|nr:hypothetical protein [Acidimicrobiales bacterium]
IRIQSTAPPLISRLEALLEWTGAPGQHFPTPGPALQKEMLAPGPGHGCKRPVSASCTGLPERRRPEARRSGPLEERGQS